MISDKPAIIDASSVINIAASGHAEELLAIVSEQVFICTYVSEKERLYLRSVDGASVEPIMLAEWIELGRLHRCELAPLEEEQFLVYAAEVDDGEAMSLAIASVRGLAFITDDRKAQKLARLDGILVLTSSQILHAWAVSQDDTTISEALRAVEDRAKFRPAADDPLIGWWIVARDTEYSR